MSTTQKVKSIILRFLEDGEIHSVKEIKEYISKQTEEIISDGVLAGSLKTMTTSRVIENVERGMYRLKQEEQAAGLEEGKNENIYDQILKLTDQYRAQAYKIINTIEITEENKKQIFEAMSLRKKIDAFYEELKEFNK